MSVVNKTNCYCGPDFRSCWFKPMRWCNHQWKNLTSPIEQDRNCLGQCIKRVLLSIPLTLATLGAGLASIPGFFQCTINNSSINEVNIIGSNQMATCRFKLNDSTLRAVEVKAIGNVVIVYNEKEQYVELTADDNLLDYLTPQIEGPGLVLGLRDGISIRTRNRISYNIHMSHRDLNKISGSGNCSIQVERLETNELQCEIKGRGTVHINNGNVVNQKIEISGDGNYNAPNFQSQNAEISIAGKGKAYLHANQSLNVTIKGMGECFYSGNPPGIEQYIAGMGQLTPL